MLDRGSRTGFSKNSCSRYQKNLTYGEVSDNTDLDEYPYAFEVYNSSSTDLTICAIPIEPGTPLASSWSAKVPAGSVRIFNAGVRRFLVTGSGLAAAITAGTASVLLHIG